MEGNDDQEGGASGRIAAASAVALAAVVVAVILLSGGDDYRVKARFESASNIVKGNAVKYGGRSVGSVESIELTDDGYAELELAIDEDFAPLRKGTRAHLRIPSLSGLASRYIDLELPPGKTGEIPDDGTLPVTQTTTQVDVDQLFDTFDHKTRRGLSQFFRGQAAMYGDRAVQANLGYRYLNPALVAADRLFREVNADTPALERFVVENARLVTDLSARRSDLSALVDRLATAFGAIASEDESLATSIGLLPPFMRRANTTFVNLRATLDELDPLVAEARPVARQLGPYLRELRPLAEDARPVIRDLRAIVRRPGTSNDLLELSDSIGPLRDIAVGPVRVNGKERPGALETSAQSLRGQTPIWEFERPYAVDLTAWFDDFSHSGLYDANGSASRTATSVSAFTTVDGALAVVPPLLREQVFNSVTRRGQNNRCPGSVERSPWRPAPDYNCDPTQVPPGK